MSNGLKIALIVAAAILIATGALIYFSPYQQCVRATAASSYEFWQQNGDHGTYAYAEQQAQISCRRNSN